MTIAFPSLYAVSMEMYEHLAALRRDGDLLAQAARTGMDAPIATCPGWQMRDLVRHVSFVHRWATTIVGQRRTRPMDEGEELALVPSWPSEAALVDWFSEGLCHTLVRTLEAASPDLVCWSFLPAPSPLAFWARRRRMKPPFIVLMRKVQWGRLPGFQLHLQRMVWMNCSLALSAGHMENCVRSARPCNSQPPTAHASGRCISYPTSW